MKVLIAALVCTFAMCGCSGSVTHEVKDVIVVKRSEQPLFKTTAYYVVVKNKDGETAKFEVSRGKWILLEEGVTVNLKYKDNLMVTGVTVFSKEDSNASQ